MNNNTFADKGKRGSLGKKLIYQATKSTTSFGLKMGVESNGLMCLLFHAVLLPKNNVESHSLLPAIALRISEYRQIFESFLLAGYEFVSAKMIYDGLPPKGRYIHVTFDDGYFNNVEVLPLLDEYSIPAHIFVATSNVVENRKYWWDVAYQRMTMAGKNQTETATLIEKLKRRDHHEIVEYLSTMFGPSVFTPESESDRPLSPDELKSLASHPLITIGNHTRDHIIMDRSSRKLVLEQVIGAQKDLANIVGYEPFSFAYPNGNYNNESLEVVEDTGFKLGFSCDFRLNHVSKDLLGKRRFKLGRFFFISNLDLKLQCQMFRVPGLSPIVLVKRCRKIIGRVMK